MRKEINTIALNLWRILMAVSMASFCVFSSTAQASSDIQAQLSDNSGNTGVSVQNSSGNEVDRMDSNGNLTTHGNVGVGTTSSQFSLLLNVSQGGAAPQYVGVGGMGPVAGPGDAFIQNNLEVDGTTYLNDVFINGLEVNGATFSGGGPSMDILTVKGSSYLATTAGNVGIGTVTPGSKLSVNGGAAIGTGLSYLTTLAPTNGLIVQGNVGIGTLSATGGNLIVNGGGNVGIGTPFPGQVLDVTGTIRSTGLTMSTGAPLVGYVLTASDTSGDTMWTAAGSITGAPWTQVGQNIFTSGSNNVGIGTSTPQGAFVVTNGNVGIGTWVPTAPLTVGGGATAFTVNSGGAITATTGITTTGGYAQTGGGVNTLSGNVGIGTTTPQGSLVVTNGNVGIGTWTPTSPLVIGINAFTVGSNGAITTTGGYAQTGAGINSLSGNVGIGTTTPQASLVVTNGNVGIGTWNAAGGNLIVNGGGNVGIGSAWPGQVLDVIGTIRSTGLTMSTGAPLVGYVLTASDTSGDTMWTAAGSITGAPWTQVGQNIFTSGSNNVGIGTSTPQGAFVVTNGNVGIGTWVPTAPLTVGGGATAFTVNSGGAITATTGITTTGGYAQTGGGVNTLSGNVGIGTTTPQGSLVVTNGNVGIGTWTPTSPLVVGINAFTVSSNGAITTTGGYAQTGAGINSLSGNVGIGTTTPQASLVVTNGNVGIGTWNAAGGNLIVNGGGNVGIGSAWPGQVLDVNGTIRTTGFNLSTGAPLTGYVLEASDTSGDAMWATVSTVSGWTLNGNNVYETKNGNVGIGTSLSSNGLDVATNVSIGTLYAGNLNAPPNSLIVQSNIGIGTWEPSFALTVGANAFTLSSSGAVTTTAGYTQTGSGVNSLSGNVGIGTAAVNSLLVVNGAGEAIGSGNASAYTLNSAPSGGLIVQNNVGIGTFNPFGGGLIVLPANTGNVGIGSLTPGQALDVTGTIRSTGLTMSTGSPILGYVLTASDTSGDSMWTAPGSISGAPWTQAGPNVYTTTGSNNVGIGTVAPTGKLEVEGGNVGIGTWVAPSGGSNNLIVQGNEGIGTTFVGGAGEAGLSVMNGNVGIGTWVPGGSLIVQGGNVGINTTSPSALFTVNGSSILGQVQNSAESISSTGLGTLAGGYAFENLGHEGIIASSGDGSIAFGVAEGGGAGGNGSITASGSGNFAFGYSEGLSGASALTASGPGGAIAMGYANGGTLEAIGQGSAAIGQNVEATANNAFALGLNVVNPTASSFMVGYPGSVGGTPTLTVTSSTVGVGIGTYTTPSGALVVEGGNVGIGTFNPFGGGLIVLPANTGNVGIGSLTPGQALDVTGTIRSTGLTMSTGSPILGYVLTASDTSGDSMWTAPGSISGAPWTQAGPNVYTTTGSNNVGIGTVAPTGKLEVEGGNVGIGTWVAPSGGTNNMLVNGNIGIGTTFVGGTGEGALSVMNGNVGIGTWVPTALLNLVSPGGGTTNLTIQRGSIAYSILGSSGASVDTGDILIQPNAPATSAGFALESRNAAGNVVDTLIGDRNGNIGLGTINAETGLAVMSGNVGIGTWIVDGTSGAGGALIVASGAGNVGIGSISPGQALDVTGTIRSTGLTMSTGSPILGYVLTASDTSGDSMWTAPGSISGAPWTQAGPNVYTTTGSNNVGIGTAAPTGFEIESHNVGIGTFVAPSGGSNNLLVNGNIGVGTTFVGGAGEASLSVMNGNVGIGTWVPSKPFQVNKDGAPFVVDANSNVGIGTTFTSNSALSVMNGFVGIGTWIPDENLSIVSTQGGSSAVEDMAAYSSTNNYDADYMFFYRARGTQAAPAAVQNNDLIFQMKPRGYGANSAFDTMGLISASVDGSPSGNHVPGELQFLAEDVNGVANGITIRSINGNVGIGTTTPGSNLSVLNNISTGDYAALAAPTGGMIVSGNVGIGTASVNSLLAVNGAGEAIGSGNASAYMVNSAPSGGLIVQNNVGIGTFNPFGGGLIVLPANTGNVGIGSLTPGQSLDVTGTVRMTGFILTASTTSGYVLTTDANGNGSWLPVTGSGTVSSSTSINRPAYYTGSTPSTTVSSGNGFYNGSNVGIGTTLNTNLLDVAGGVTIGTAYAGYQTAPTNGLAVQGNVGIGSLTPGQSLDVTGTIRSTGLTMSTGAPLLGYVLTASDTSGDSMWVAPGSISGAPWTQAGPNVYTTTGSNNVGIGTVAPTGFEIESHNVGIGTFVAPSGGSNNLLVNGNIGIGTTFIGGSGEGALTVMNGNVGIGTWVPASALGVVGTITAEASATRTVSISNDGSGNANIVTDPTNTGYIWLWPGNSRMIGASSSGDLLIGTNADTGLSRFADGVIEINSGSPTPTGSLASLVASNIGIGTTAVNSALVVNGAVGIGTGNASAYEEITAPSGGLIVQNNVGIGTFNPFGGGLIVLPAQTGNVGIGSLTPGQVLDVTGTIRSTGLTMSTGSPILGYVLTASDTSGDSMWTAPGSISGAPWTQSGANVYTTTGGNNVGIGTAAPTGFEIESHNVGIGTWIAPSGGTNNLIVQGNEGIGTTFVGGAGEAGLSIMNGNVGIGTWLPGALFQVGNGATPFTIATNGTTTTSGSLTVGDFGNLNLSSGSGISWTYSSIVGGGGSGNNYLHLGISGGANMYFLENNIGIGTNTPQAVFDIVGNVGIGTLGVGDLFTSTAPPKGGMIIEGNVGIGSINPGQILDVTGTIRSTGLTMSTGSPILGYVLTASDTSGDSMWTAPGSISGAPWTQSGANVYTTTGGNNVGIGTAAPTGFEIESHNVGIGTFVAPSGGSNNLLVNGNIGVGTTFVGGAGEAGLSIMNGNVGIGTWVPGTQLMLASGGGNGIQISALAGVIDSIGQNLNIQVNGGTAIDLAGGSGMTFNYTPLFDVPSNTNFNIDNSSGSTVLFSAVPSLNGVGIGTVAPTGRFEIEGGNVGIGTWTVPSGGSNNLVVQGNIGVGTTFVGGTGEGALTVMNGNVGIGTWVPSVALQIVSATNPQVRIYGGSTQRLTLNVAGGISYAYGYDDGASAYTDFVIGSSSGVGSPPIYVKTNGSAGGGNVGIGTTSPAGALTVMNGNVGIGTWVPGGSLIVNGGNVGIGSNVPGQALDVTGTIRSTGLTMSTGSPILGYVLTASDTSGDSMWTAPGSISGAPWTQSGVNVYTSTGSNNVGIGTAAPTGFEIESHNVGIGTFIAPSGGSNNLLVNGNIGIGTTFIGGSGEGALTVMNGNVGIGTWVPSAMFQVGSADVQFTVDKNGFITQAGTVGYSIGGGSVFVNGNGNVNFGNNYGGSGISATFQGGENANSKAIIESSTLTGNGDSIVMKFGNVGIGTEEVQMTAGGVGIGTFASTYITTTPPAGGLILGGNVGIGSTNPGQILDVTGTVRMTGFNLSTSPTNGYVLTSDTNGNGTWAAAGSSSQWITTAGVGIGTYSNVGIGTVTPQGALVVTNGNVGIGTWAPVDTLQVGNYVSSTSGLEVDSNGNVGIGTTITSNASMSIMNGNVGIGTWVPRAEIEISNAASNTLRLTSSGNNDYPTVALYGQPGGAGQDFGNIDFGFNSQSAASSRISSYRETGAGNGGSSLEFYTSNSATGNLAETARFDLNGNLGIGTTFPGGGLVVMNGNVGIGTWVPNALFQVGTGATTITDPFSVTSAGVGYFKSAVTIGGNLTASGVYALANGTGIFGNSDSNAGNSTLYMGGEDSTAVTTIQSAYLATGNGDYINFKEGNVGIGTIEVMRMVNGNVGIGTTTPQGALVVTYGNVGIGTWTTAGGNLIVNGGGNVGIGSAWPGQVLDVTGTIRSTGLTMSTGSPILGYVLTASDTSGDSMWTAPGNISGAPWTQTGVNVYTSTGSNNVGIGTAAPTGFEIESHNVGIGTFVAPSGGSNNLLVNGNVGIGTTFVGGANEGSMSIMNGNVGIGTWVPNSILNFNGSVAGAVKNNVGSVTLDSTYYLVLVDTSASRTIVLPSAIGTPGRCYRVKDWGGTASTNNITVNTTGGQTIDGQSSLVMIDNYQSTDLCSDGSEWYIF